MRRALFILVLPVALSSCLVALPSSRFTGGVGVAAGTEGDASGPSADGAAGAVHGRFGVVPLGMVDALADRPADLELGYTIEHFPGTPTEHAVVQGTYVGAQWFPWQSDDRSLRLGLGASAELVWNLDEQLGAGVVGGAELGFVRFLDDETDANSKVLGVLHGEGGLALATHAGYRQVGDQRYFLGSLDLVWRTPALAGFLFGF
jgi:hypothetical protein